MIRHAWLQKHASPTASDGAFHWHPADGDRELRAHVVERARGLEPPAVLWELEPGRVVWARVFAATAPHDHRRYTGLVLTIVEQPGASTIELLDALTLPMAMPWSDDVATAHVGAPRDVDAAELAPLVRSLLDGTGGRVAIAASVLEALPATVRALEQVVPETTRVRVRRGAWLAAVGEVRAAGAAAQVALLAARACLAPGSRPARAWTMLRELAASSGRTVDEVGAEVWSAHDDLASSLHAWGRERIGATALAIGDPAARRHADTLVLRVVEHLAADLDPASSVAAARWHALLPADRRALLFELAVRRCPSMRSLVSGGAHA